MMKILGKKKMMLINTHLNDIGCECEKILKNDAYYDAHHNTVTINWQRIQDVKAKICRIEFLLHGRSCY